MLAFDRPALRRSLFALLLAGCCGGTTPAVTDRGVGEACTNTTECRLGLECLSDATCHATRSGAAGSSCILTLDCAMGLYCGASRRCETSGTGVEGADCNDVRERRGVVDASLAGVARRRDHHNARRFGAVESPAHGLVGKAPAQAQVDHLDGPRAAL